MKIAAYQFAGSGNIEANFKKIHAGVAEAAEKGVRVLVFHECALTGYPPLECLLSGIDFEKAEAFCRELCGLAQKHKMYLFVGTAMRENGKVHNSARVFAPSGSELQPYHKRALWGWDRDNFSEGSDPGLYEIDGIRIGVRICFEVRFPEFFRELYADKADLALVLFCDSQPEEDMARYEKIRGHLQTRAVENILPLLSVNNSGHFQTAPTAMFDAHGTVVAEARRGEQTLLVYDFYKKEEDFGSAGIRYMNEKIGIRKRAE